jgi:cytochrome c peroxidase
VRPEIRRAASAAAAAALLALGAAAEDEIVPAAELRGHAAEAMAASFLPDGRRIVSGSDDKTIRIWDAASGRQESAWPDTGALSAVAVSSDGALVASGGDEGKVKLWDARTGKLLFVWKHGKSVGALAFLPDRRLVLSAGDDTLIRVWDAVSGAELAPWRGHEGGVRALAASADGRKIVSGGKDGAVRVWDAATGRPLVSLPGHRGAVFSVAISSTGARALSGGADGTVRFWDVAAATAAVWRGAGAMVPAVALSPDGRTALWGDDAGDLHYGDAAAGRALESWPGLGSTVISVGFSPDGRTAVSAGWDGVPRTWEIPPRRRKTTVRGEAKLDALAKEALRRLEIHEIPVGEPKALNPATVELGRKLFFDPRLSKDGTISCSSCHKPDKAFADGLPVAVGIRGLKGPRNSPSLLSVANNHYTQFMWDGRLDSIDAAALGAIQNPIEMDMDLKGVAAAVGVPPAQAAGALAVFIRSLARPDDSPFDRFRLGKAPLSPAALRGFVVFAGKARCLHCHATANFTDSDFHRIGLKSLGPDDPGRLPFDSRAENRGAFRTPTLRNVALTAPYMHDGRFSTLREVVDFYDRGGDVPADDMAALHLTEAEKTDLLAFLDSLTSPEPGTNQRASR